MMNNSALGSALSIAGMAIGLASLGLLFSFGFWASRRAELRSLPWIGIHLIINNPVLILLNAWLLRKSLGHPLGMPTYSFRTNFALFFGAEQTLMAIATLLLAILVMADAAYLLERSGVALDNAGVRVLMIARKRAFGIGLCAAILALLNHLLALSYRI